MSYRMHKVAILDMYDGTPNQGMRAIKEILDEYQGVLQYTVYDVRGGATLPDMDYDIFISTGGPGNPLEGDGVWDTNYFKLIDRIFTYNRNSKINKKYLFLICHSFQMVANHLGLGQITKRQSMSFGTFPVHMTPQGINDPLLKNLEDPFYVADFRYYQLIEPNEEKLNALGAEILALEKIRPHIDLERAIMMIRYSNEIIGTQYHPEGDAQGMLEHFQVAERKEAIIAEHGEDKFQQMIRDLSHPGKIQKTHDEVIPGFLNQAIEGLIDQLEQTSSTKS